MPIERLASSLPVAVLNDISLYLNPSLPGKDYKSLAGEMEFDYLTVKNIERETNPTECLLHHWFSGNPNETVQDLIRLVVKIGRNDVKKLLEKYRYVERKYQRSFVEAKVKEGSSDLSTYASDDANSTSSLPYTLPIMGPAPPYSVATGSSDTTSSTICADDEDHDTDEELDRKLRGSAIENDDPSYDEMLHPQYQFRRSSTISNSTSSSAYTSDRPGSLHSPPEGDVAPFASFIHQPVIANDKVALVIGNENYVNITGYHPLHYVHKDAYNFTLALKELYFRVISLVDLNLREMRTMMLAFTKMLGPGVFGVFYFAGHGFEEDGQNYLMPVDAQNTHKASEFIAAQEILKEMQLRDTKLNLFIIDACRLKGVNKEGEQKISQPIRRVPVGNTIIAYSCQTNMPSFETRYQENGVYMTELLKHIKEDRRIEHILMDVTSAVNRNQFVWQRPVLETDSIEDCRLTAPVDRSSILPSAINSMWSQADLTPEDEEFIRDEGIDFKIKFKNQFSNMLDIEIWAESHLPGGVKMIKNNLICADREVEQYENNVNVFVQRAPTLLHKYRLLNIQRAKASLFFVLEMSFYSEQTNLAIPIHLKCDLRKPLIVEIFNEFDTWIVGKPVSRKETAV